MCNQLKDEHYDLNFQTFLTFTDIYSKIHTCYYIYKCKILGGSYGTYRI